MGGAIRRLGQTEGGSHWRLDCPFDQDRIQRTDKNYLANRITLNNIGLNALKAAQKSFAERKQKYSVKTLQNLCSSPAGALETLAMVLDMHSIVDESKS